MMAFPIAIMTMDDSDDRSFMEQLYIENQYLLFKVAFDIVKSQQTAEDMVSEACVSMIRNIDTVRRLEVRKRRAYIVATVRNAALDYVRKRDSQSQKYFLTGEERDFDVPEQAQIDDDLIRRAEADQLRMALKKIHRSERELLQMKYFDLLPDAEIAKKLQIGTNSVRFYLTRARRSLKRILEEEERA